jgi:hypothetical protein
MTYPQHSQPRKLAPTLAGLMLIATASWSGARADGTVKIPEFSKSLGDQGTLTLKGIEFADTNLSENEIKSILSASKPGDADQLIGKLNASSIAVSEATIAAADHTISLRDLRATEVKQGKIGRVSTGPIEAKGDVPGAGEGTLRIRSTAIEKIDFSAMLPGGTRTPSSSPVDADRMVFSDIEVTVPDAETPKEAPGGNLYRIALASITLAGHRNGDVTTSTASFDKLVIVPPKSSQAAQSLTQAGYDQITFDAKFAGHHNAKARTYVVEDLSVSWPGAGALGFDAKLGGIDEGKMNSGQDAVDKMFAEADISHLGIRIVNLGYFEKALAEEAVRQKKTPEQIKAEWQATLAILMPIDASDPTAKKITSAASAFIANPKSLTITLDAKGAPIKFSDFATLAAPDELLAVVEINVVAGQ